jgi:hypothetical protein
MTARDQSLEDAFVTATDGSAMSSDPEWRYVPDRRFSSVSKDTHDDYGGTDSFGESDAYGGPDSYGAEDILL